MSELGALILVLAAQVTLPVVGGLLLSRRRDPAAACAPLAVAGLAVVLLTPLAFVPRPSWQATESPRPASNASVPIETSPPVAGSPAQSGIDLVKLFRLPQPQPVAATTSTVDPWQWCAWIGLVLAGVGSLRFTIGLFATIRVVRRSPAIDDRGLLLLAAELRQALGCRRAMVFRESPNVGSAATAGWRRPVILLSRAWRLWTIDETRAVLAHEIAHVARGDFLSRLVARLAVALHGYHPLVRWLSARLELRQEMAADAIAASTCGGRQVYLKCLAALALKADARSIGPVPTFLSRPQTLLRRIAMLRVTDDTIGRSRRWPILAVVALLAVAGLGLRGTTPQSLAGPVIRANAVEKKPRPPLDASFILPSDHADEVGVFAIRVADLCKVPGMDKMAAMYSEMLKSIMGDDKKTHFAFTDIDQVAGRVNITHDPAKPAPNRSLTMSLTSIRMVKDFDWPKQLKEWGTNWKEHTHATTKYYSAKMSVPFLGFMDATVWFYLPDARTAVLESEENIKKLIDAKGKPAATKWADDWKEVEGGMFAMVLPDLKGKVAKKLPTEKQEDKVREAVLKSVSAICSKANRAAIGIDIGEGCSVKLRFACGSAEDAADVDQGCQALAKLAETMIDDDKDDPADALDKAGKNLSVMLVRGINFSKTVDHVVEVRMTAKTGVQDLLKAFETTNGRK